MSRLRPINSAPPPVAARPPATTNPASSRNGNPTSRAPSAAELLAAKKTARFVGGPLDGQTRQVALTWQAHGLDLPREHLLLGAAPGQVIARYRLNPDGAAYTAQPTAEDPP